MASLTVYNWRPISHFFLKRIGMEGAAKIPAERTEVDLRNDRLVGIWHLFTGKKLIYHIILRTDDLI
jgi:hypothetical protein